MNCPACSAPHGRLFYRQSRVPVNTCLLHGSAAEATGLPRGELELAWCPSCGFVWNHAFDPDLAEYSSRYEETQAFSEHFSSFAGELAKRWVERYNLHGRTVLEIGCGKGEFLVEMIEAGAGRGIGIDPGTRPERIDHPATERIEWIVDFYGERYADIDADAVVCRHTLEHIRPVAEFLALIRRAVGDRKDVVILFEVPDVLRVLEEPAFWDIYYEHCSYFSAGSLARLFRAQGFEVLTVRREYDDQYLIVEAQPARSGAPHRPLDIPAIEDDMGRLERWVAAFGESTRRCVDGWRHRVGEVVTNGGRAVIWGAGSKGVSFLNALEPSGIDFAVDINPHKHGTSLAGGGQRVVPPAHLQDYRPDLVVAMNPVYVREIGRELRRLGVETCLEAV